MHVPAFKEEDKQWYWIVNDSNSDVEASVKVIVMDYLRLKYSGVVLKMSRYDITMKKTRDIFVSLEAIGAISGKPLGCYTFSSLVTILVTDTIYWRFRFLYVVHLVQKVTWFVKYCINEGIEIGFARLLKDFLY